MRLSRALGAARVSHQTEAGHFRFFIEYRDVQIDEGVSIHIYGPVNGSNEEVLRFDCFDDQPHYHLGFSYRDEPFIRIDDIDPLAWSLSQITSRFDELLASAGSDPMNPEEQDRMPAVVKQLTDWGQELSGGA